MFNSNTFIKNLRNGILSNFKKKIHNRYSAVNINPIYLKYLKHLPEGKVRSHQLFNKKTRFSNGPEYLHGITEIFIEEIYKQNLPKDALILDCGANIGLSVIYMKRLCPSARVIAFEPDKHNFNLLKQNVLSHEVTDVTLVNKAIWTTNGLISFKSEGSMGSKIEKDNENAEKIEATRLKDYLNQQVSFLKIDIEGVEYDVLKDIQPNLHNVQNMFLEYHGNFNQNRELVEIFEILNQSGFSFYIKEAANVYPHPFIYKEAKHRVYYDVQLNIFCFRK